MRRTLIYKQTTISFLSIFLASFEHFQMLFVPLEDHQIFIVIHGSPQNFYLICNSLFKKILPDANLTFEHVYLIPTVISCVINVFWYLLPKVTHLTLKKRIYYSISSKNAITSLKWKLTHRIWQKRWCAWLQ